MVRWFAVLGLSLLASVAQAEIGTYYIENAPNVKYFEIKEYDDRATVNIVWYEHDEWRSSSTRICQVDEKIQYVRTSTLGNYLKEHGRISGMDGIVDCDALRRKGAL